MHLPASEGEIHLVQRLHARESNFNAPHFQKIVCQTITTLYEKDG
jgi:hypothetical protein